MTKRNVSLLMVMIVGALWKAAPAGAPLPLHNIEGNSGVFITSTAYLANPPEEGKWLGLPSMSISGAFIGEKDFQSYAITENLFGCVEVGYAGERLGLGDWSDDVKAAGFNVSNSVMLHNLNTRVMTVKEGDFDCPWMPAITFGAHFKWNDGIDTIDDQLGGLCDTLGVDHTFGTELTAVASKTIANLLPRPVIISAGLRNGDAIHTGFLGFAGERKTTFEGSVIVFLTDQLAFASEYRQKSDLVDQCGDLVKAENDWWDLCLAYVIDDHLTISGGYANFGNVLNHREGNVWAFQLKYEF